MLILKKMKEVPENKRTARFICSIAIALPDGREFIAEASCEGLISNEPKGNNGFGYDPIFYVPEFHKTMAELPLDVKNKISHRGKALDMATKIIMDIANESR